MANKLVKDEKILDQQFYIRYLPLRYLSVIHP